jgi:hypothetical protein
MGAREGSRWKRIRSGYAFMDDRRKPDAAFFTLPWARSEATAAEQDIGQKSVADIDWLTYRHWPCVASPAKRTIAKPIWDSCGYNQGLSRPLNDVSDFWGTCSISADDFAFVALRVDDGWGPIVFTITYDSNGYVFRAKKIIDGEVTSISWETVVEPPWCCEWGRTDGRIFLFLNSWEIASLPLTVRARPEGGFQPTAIPLAVGGNFGSSAVSRLRVYRDVHYLDPNGAGADWSLGRPLETDEYFVLGDNSPVSTDSRQWGSGVPRAKIVGRVIPQPVDGTR